MAVGNTLQKSALVERSNVFMCRKGNQCSCPADSNRGRILPKNNAAIVFKPNVPLWVLGSSPRAWTSDTYRNVPPEYNKRNATAEPDTAPIPTKWESSNMKVKIAPKGAASAKKPIFFRIPPASSPEPRR
mmetsp:Transcript_19723/g.32852  ORF Transcript_19723/g.32852 Transcript_19723/m.32852 type:complete len:130 (+) Transcript_19723:657-1046(+)